LNQDKKAVCTVGLIAANVIVFLAFSFLGDTENTLFMLNHGAAYGPYISEGHQYYRLFTSLFLHFGINHLLNNMVLLGALGWNLELETGKLKFLLIYFAAGLGGNLFSFWLNDRAGAAVVSAGASGAIFGLMGALLWVVIKNHGRAGRLTRRGILFMVALSLYFGVTSSGVDNAAHIGGLVCGFAAAVILYHRKYQTPISAV